MVFLGRSSLRFTTRIRWPSGDKPNDGPGLSLNCVCRIIRGGFQSKEEPARTSVLNQRLPLRNTISLHVRHHFGSLPMSEIFWTC